VYEWLLFLHVAAAFALVAAYVMYWAIGLALRRLDRPSSVLLAYRVARPADILGAIGFIGTLVFGIWLAIYVDVYELWDPWILGAVVIWAVAGETGRRAGNFFNRGRDRARELVAAGADGPDAELEVFLHARETLIWHALSSAAVLLLLIDMIYKPGA
jgi:hypothetical protein